MILTGLAVIAAVVVEAAVVLRLYMGQSTDHSGTTWVVLHGPSPVAATVVGMLAVVAIGAIVGKWNWQRWMRRLEGAA